jgi:hypothetical protein
MIASTFPASTSLHHGGEARTVKAGAGDAVIRKMNWVRKSVPAGVVLYQPKPEAALGGCLGTAPIKRDVHRPSTFQLCRLILCERQFLGRPGHTSAVFARIKLPDCYYLG